jgi:hypothetical protein
MNASKRNDRRQARTVGFRSNRLTAPSSELAGVDLADNRPVGVHGADADSPTHAPPVRSRRAARRRVGSNGSEYDITIT